MADLFELTDLAAYLQQDLDTATATEARTQATNYLRRELGVEFTSASRVLNDRVASWVTYAHLIGPLTSVESVSINGDELTLTQDTDYERTRRGVICPAGFGSQVDGDYVDLTIVYTAGFATVPDDLRDAGLQLAATSYLRPKPGVRSTSTQIDDYQVREDYSEDAGGAVVALDPATLRDLRSIYGARKPRAGSVAYQ